MKQFLQKSGKMTQNLASLAHFISLLDTNTLISKTLFMNFADISSSKYCMSLRLQLIALRMKFKCLYQKEVCIIKFVVQNRHERLRTKYFH